MRDEVKEANDLLIELQDPMARLPILAMDKRTMAEIRSYSKASPLMHQVMQAALLLLGEDEGVTAVSFFLPVSVEKVLR